MLACYGILFTVTVACRLRCQGALSDTLGHHHSESHPHEVPVWLVQELLVVVCSGESAVLGRGAVQQSFHAFLTNASPCANPHAPPLRVRTLCWVRNSSSSCYNHTHLSCLAWCISYMQKLPQVTAACMYVTQMLDTMKPACASKTAPLACFYRWHQS